ncbi:hypothetical protein [Candidatus Thiosymbion oneisti]|uniref:hypothetical protein n=1 Tax=Candidatus Thiosymbion oneisti TaxID=589554 RepID=UPI001C406770|nr:hypothetical protein [Candidatus Thiosymbion oneisti]
MNRLKNRQEVLEMAYSDFTLIEIKEKFQFETEEETNIFPIVTEEKISGTLNEILKENIPLALAIHTEKARSEMIVTPILIELRKILNHRISLFSGVEFNVDKEKGLNGVCDYIISLSKEQLYINSPVISVVEAKNDNIKSGLAQCAAEMIAARIFNEKKGNQINAIYGIVTTGSNWRFLKLDDILYIDVKEYYLEQLGIIMGILLHIVNSEISESGS